MRELLWLLCGFQAIALWIMLKIFYRLTHVRDELMAAINLYCQLHNVTAR